MKNEAINELIKTLNGQLRELPSAAKMMVHQYQTSAIVLSVACVIFMIAIFAGMVYVTKKLYSRAYEEHHNDVKDILQASWIGGVIAEGVLIFSLSVNLIHAFSPISSLISDFLP